MKHFSKILFLLTGFLTEITALWAQDCASGYCPEDVVVHHIQGKYSAQTVDLTYNFLEITGYDGETYCWMDRNIGASGIASDQSAGYETWGWYYPWCPSDHLYPYYKNENNSITTMSYLPAIEYYDPIRSSDLSASDGSDFCSILFGSNVVTPSTDEVNAIIHKITNGVDPTTITNQDKVAKALFWPAAGYGRNTNAETIALQRNYSSTTPYAYSYFATRTISENSTSSKTLFYSVSQIYYKTTTITYNTKVNHGWYNVVPRRCIIKL